MYTKHRLIDNPNISLARARELDPGIPVFAWRITANFTPRSITAHQWEPIRGFVADVVVRMKRHTPDGVRRVNTMVASFVNWVHVVHGAKLSFEEVFSAQHVERYLESRRLVQKSAAYRSAISRQLSLVGAELAGADIPRRKSYAPKFSAKVLTDRDLATLYSWAHGLSTGYRRQNACAVLSLSAGAGLNLSEIACAQVEDVEYADELVLINVRGRRPRTVPMLKRWVRTLEVAIGSRLEGPMFQGFRLEEYPPRSIQAFLWENPAPIRVSSRELRRHWVLTQLRSGNPADIVAQVAGLADVGGLSNYCGYLPEPTAEAYFAQIASAGVR